MLCGQNFNLQLCWLKDFRSHGHNLGSSQQGCCPTKLVFDSSMELSHLVVALQDLQISLIDLTLSSFFSSSQVLGGLFHVLSLVLQEVTELLGFLLEGRCRRAATPVTLPMSFSTAPALTRV